MGRKLELTLWVDNSIDETSTRAPRPLGEKSQIEEVLRYIPVVGLMLVVPCLSSLLNAADCSIVPGFSLKMLLLSHDVADLFRSCNSQQQPP